MKARRIKIKFDKGMVNHGGELSGWLDGKTTYLWFRVNGNCVGTLSDKKLYRLAKAIVKEMDSAK